MNLADNAERILEQTKIKTRPETDQRILNDAYMEFAKSSLSGNRKIGQTVNINRFFKIAAVAAIAVTLTAVSIIKFNSKAARPKPIYNALVRSGDFSISCYHPGFEEPYMQVWVSKSMETKMFKTIEAGSVLLTLWDIPGNIKITSDIPVDTAKTEFISKKLLAELEESIVKAFSFSEFTNMNQIPQGASWSKIKDLSIISQLPDSTAYDLTWQHKNSEGIIIYYKWRMFVTRNTNKIRRAELYVKTTQNSEYELNSYIIISYPTPEEIENIINENFDLIRSDPKYRSTGVH